jgi:nucleotide-binding universal stress UspA family protein
MENIARQLRNKPQGQVSVDEVLSMLESVKIPEESKLSATPRWEGDTDWRQESDQYTLRAPTGAFPGRGRGFTAMGPRTGAQRAQAVKFRFEPITLVVLTDGSEHSHKALEAALHFRRRNDYIHVVNCVQLAGPEDQPSFKEANAALKSKGKHVIDEARQEINEREIGRWVCTSVAAMDPKKAALEYAQKQGASILFVGTRGKDSTTKDFYPGSFAKYIFDNADCSVMVVR